MAACLVESKGVTLQWDPNSEPDLAGYKVYFGETNTAPTMINAGMSTSVMFTNLVAGKTYYFYATAYNSAGLESNPSSQVTYSVPSSSNSAPTISNIADQNINEDTSTRALNFTVGDAETAAGSLSVSGSSSNTGLVPNGNIVFGGSGANRTVTLTPASGQTGTATITVSVSDGTASASDSFLLSVNSQSVTNVASFRNPAPISIPDEGPSPTYPSTINVSGMSGTIREVAVVLNGFSHTWPNDVDVLLVSPSGAKTMIFSDVGGGGNVNNLNFTLKDSAANRLPAGNTLVSGTYKPTDAKTGDILFSPAPGGSYSSLLSTFAGSSPNGTWSLFVSDDGPGDQGSFAGGWQLSLTTTSTSGTPASPTISTIANQSTTVNTPTQPVPFTVSDSDTPATSLTLIGSSSNPTLVPNSNIVFGGSGNDRTVILTPAPDQSGTATITISVGDGQNQASTSFGLSVSPASGFVGTQAFTNSTSISIPDKGASTPYPSSIGVSGMGGGISDVSVTLRNLTHTYTSDLDILLVSPTGQAVVLASDAGSGPANNATIIFSDSASSVLPNSPMTSGTFRPANYSDASSGGDNYLAPAPAGPYGGTLSIFKNISANGTWSLYVMDDGPGDVGSFAGGWSLSITTSGTTPASSLEANLTADPLSVENQRMTLRISDNKEGVSVEAIGNADQKYILESSTDLLTWESQPFVPDENGMLSLNEQKQGKRFYRVRQVQ